jgi:acyl carrier protein
MMEQALVGRIHRILVEEFELAEPDLTTDANLYSDLGLDSLDTVDLIVALEKEFGFKVIRAKDEERIRQLQTLGDLCTFADDKLQAANQPACESNPTR